LARILRTCSLWPLLTKKLPYMWHLGLILS